MRDATTGAGTTVRYFNVTPAFNQNVADSTRCDTENQMISSNRLGEGLPNNNFILSTRDICSSLLEPTRQRLVSGNQIMIHEKSQHPHNSLLGWPHGADDRQFLPQNPPQYPNATPMNIPTSPPWVYNTIGLFLLNPHHLRQTSMLPLDRISGISQSQSR